LSPTRVAATRLSYSWNALEPRREHIVKRAIRRTGIALLVLLLIAGGLIAYDHRPSKGHPSALTPADTALHKSWLYFYPSRGEPARAVMVFFGNDVAFWEPHQDLAWRIAGDGISVVGIDVRKYLATLPDDEPARDASFAADMPQLIERSRRALSADSL